MKVSFLFFFPNFDYKMITTHFDAEKKRGGDAR